MSPRIPTSKSTVFIARHGERIDHVDETWKESAALPHDPHLTERGLRQAKDLAERLQDSDIRHIFVSPFQRCIQTANQVAELLDIPLKVEEGACEYLSQKYFDSMPKLWGREELAKKFDRIDKSYVTYHKMKYPEGVPEIAARTKATVHHLVENYLDEGNILIVGHGYSVEMLAKGLCPDSHINWITYCSLVECIREDDGGFVIGANAETSFMSEPENAKRHSY